MSFCQKLVSSIIRQRSNCEFAMLRYVTVTSNKKRTDRDSVSEDMHTFAKKVKQQVLTSEKEWHD